MRLQRRHMMVRHPPLEAPERHVCERDTQSRNTTGQHLSPSSYKALGKRELRGEGLASAVGGPSGPLARIASALTFYPCGGPTAGGAVAVGVRLVLVLATARRGGTIDDRAKRFCRAVLQCHLLLSFLFE